MANVKGTTVALQLVLEESNCKAFTSNTQSATKMVVEHLAKCKFIWRVPLSTSKALMEMAEKPMTPRAWFHKLASLEIYSKENHYSNEDFPQTQLLLEAFAYKGWRIRLIRFMKGSPYPVA